MSDTRRLDSLKRRVQQDPASIAFAALADEYRRQGLFHDAIETCRAGLTRHPAYLSARVTLGRSLLEIGEYDEAETELEQVIRAAPDNLAAIRALAEIHRRRGDAPDGYAVESHEPATAPASPAPMPAPPRAGPPAVADAAPIASAGSPVVAAGSSAAPVDGTVVRPDRQADAGAPGVIPISPPVPDAPPLEVVSHMAPREDAPSPETAAAAAPDAVPGEPASPPVPGIDPVCERLEQFLAAIDRARAEQDPDAVAGRR